MTLKLTERVLFVLLVFVLITLEILSGLAAFETMGAVASTLYLLAVGLNLPLVLISGRKLTMAVAGIVLLALVIIPYQGILVQRLSRVQSEAARIVIYAYETRLADGTFPVDLSEYRYHDPDMRSYIQEFRQDASVGGFILCYRVGTESTSHCYSPKTGWSYYAD